MSADSIPVWERRFRAPALYLPMWSRLAPERAVYVSNESGSFQTHAWDIGTGERRLVSQEPVGVIDAAPTGDGEGVLWFRDESGDESGAWILQPYRGGEARPRFPELPKGWSGGIAVGRRVDVVSLSDADGFAAYASEEGGRAREVARNQSFLHVAGTERGGFLLGGLSAGEDLLCLETADPGDSLHPSLRVVDTATAEIVGEQWDGEGKGLHGAAWSPVPGDRRIAIVHERDGEEHPAIWDLTTGTRTDLELGLQGLVDVYDWWPDGSALLLVNLREARDELFRYEVGDGVLTRIPHPEGAISEARVRPDGAVWYRLSSGAHDARILSDAGEEVIAPEGERAPDGRPYRSWFFTNPGGQRVHGWIVTPPGDGAFPVIMQVHGGPTWLYRDSWMPMVQAYVDAGFAVGMVNYRGSVGYGVEWRDTLIGNIGFPETEDVLAGLEDLIARGIADPERAVIAGWSWGGYITLLSLGLHPERWIAGVAGVPVGDYAASYDDLSPPLQAYDRALLGGTPDEVPDLMVKRNPITYVGHVKAPVLVLAGEQDSRCPIRQVMIYIDALADRGAEHELYTYGTGHGTFVIDEDVRQMRVVLDFLQKRVPGVRGPNG